MIELLALPDWNTPPRPIDDWVAKLTEAGQAPTLTRESPGVIWLEIASLRLRGYAVIEGPHVSAINFELAAPDTEPAVQLLQAAANSLGWELQPDDDDEEDDFEI